MLRSYRTTQRKNSATSEQILLSPVEASHVNSHKPSEEVVHDVAAGEDDREKQRRRVYLVLIWITLLFFLINIAQIAFIYELNNIYWIAIFPAVLFAICLLYLTYEIKKNWKGLSQVNEHPKCPNALHQIRNHLNQ